LALTLRQKVLIGLFAFDIIVVIAAAAVGVAAFTAWIILNIFALLIWRGRSNRRKISGSITIERQYGTPQTTLKGEHVRSYGEKTVADYFFKSNIRYEYEQPAWSTRGRRISRPDFYLPDFDVYVEYWGMADVEESTKREEYVRSMKWKMAKYHQNGIKFVSLYRENLNNIDWIFKAKLRDETGIDLNKM
jgi:hypothetical protein